MSLARIHAPVESQLPHQTVAQGTAALLAGPGLQQETHKLMSMSVSATGKCL